MKEFPCFVMLIDTKLGLSDVAWKILKNLSRTRIAKVTPWNEAAQEYDITIGSSAWYNGRESGVVLRVSHPSLVSLDDILFITFAEHPSCDDILITEWLGKWKINPPTSSDRPRYAWDNQTRFKEWEVPNATQFIIDRIRLYLEQRALIYNVIQS